MREYSIGVAAGLEPSLPPDLAARLAQIGPRRRFARNDTIYTQGEPADCVYHLLSGRAKSSLVGAGGQESILRIHLAQSVMGLTALASEPVRDATATALEPIEVVVATRERFLRLMRAEPEMGVHLARLLIDRMRDFHHRVGDLLALSVEQRLARTLLAVSTPDPDRSRQDTGVIPLTHEELAQLINARRPTVSGVLARFAALGLVARRDRRLTVVDRAGLVRLSAG